MLPDALIMHATGSLSTDEKVYCTYKTGDRCVWQLRTLFLRQRVSVRELSGPVGCH